MMNFRWMNARYRSSDVTVISWCGVWIDFSRPGKPTDNAHVESFNGTFRAECLEAH